MKKKKNLTENIHGKGDIDIDKCNKISYAEAKRRRNKENTLFEYPTKEVEPDLFPEPTLDTTNKELF